MDQPNFRLTLLDCCIIIVHVSSIKGACSDPKSHIQLFPNIWRFWYGTKVYSNFRRLSGIYKICVVSIKSLKIEKLFVRKHGYHVLYKQKLN